VYDDVLRAGSDRGNDLVAVQNIGGAMLVLVLATVLPAPAAGILIAVTVFAGGVYYRQVTGMDAIDQRLDVVDGDPAFLPAGCPAT
jgi:hypothetical protein